MTLIQDHTVQKNAQNEFNQLLAGIETFASVVELDVFGNVTRVNDVTCKLSGYSREELIGQSYRQIDPEYHPAGTNETQRWTVKCKEVWAGEVKNRAKDGSFYWTQTVVSPIKDLSGEIKKLIAVRFDISEIKRQQEALEAQKAVTISSASLAALGEMAGGIAHEINNPLAVIHALARQSQRKFAEFPVVCEAFGRIETVSAKIAKIIRGLRSITRQADADPMESCQVVHIIADAVDVCRERIKSEGVELKECEIATDLIISARPVQLSQVILNLLNNAVDALTERPEEVLGQWISITAQAVGNTIEIRITDSGPGIPVEIRSKILQPFFTTKPVGKGTGLGLSISNGIVTSCGGRLYVDDTVPNTCFVISLPTLRDAAPEPVAA